MRHVHLHMAETRNFSKSITGIILCDALWKRKRLSSHVQHRLCTYCPYLSFIATKFPFSISIMNPVSKKKKEIKNPKLNYHTTLYILYHPITLVSSYMTHQRQQV